MRLKLVLRVLGLLGMLLSLTMLWPLFWSWRYQSGDGSALMLSIGIGIVFGLILFLFGRGKGKKTVKTADMKNSAYGKRSLSSAWPGCWLLR